jgi:hypothetical protein
MSITSISRTAQVQKEAPKENLIDIGLGDVLEKISGASKQVGRLKGKTTNFDVTSLPSLKSELNSLINNLETISRVFCKIKFENQFPTTRSTLQKQIDRLYTQYKELLKVIDPSAEVLNSSQQAFDLSTLISEGLSLSDETATTENVETTPLTTNVNNSTPSPTKFKEVVVVHCNTYGEKLFIRGAGPGLSWNEGEGIELESIGDNKYVFRLENAYENFEFKICKGTAWSQGENYKVEANGTAEINPQF